ncbi:MULTISPECIES: patatin-like phospholipase family protein [Nitrosomonas]|uniref:NTE family protein n=1 Tax=Nitrosomonas communis TaxID=44574 RepID=A0A0F7KCV4_9PROT|nr:MULTISPECIES: patatin-like phospholipase family protein [Nitrosomonas]AKH37411.1 Patatin [Nitrosomonas communis]TYP91405.1 NTE family protein [Nitrosomonas communis]UVS62637.1 patatin-like phospholipase family protein [Nitrosomonas sp. PLL12]
MSEPNNTFAQSSKLGLFLTGGGARAAYQVGVLRAIAELLPSPAHSPFPVICGTSAGAINAAGLAMSATHFATGVRQLEAVWGNLHVDQVHRADLLGVIRNTAHCVGSLLSSQANKKAPFALLDNAPLRTLLGCRLPFRGIQRSIHLGALHALGVTVWGYTSGQSVTFYQGNESIQPWSRVMRIGVASRIGIQHLLASSAIPLIFPAVRLNREYFGDGSMRQLAPLSPALHLGADRILVISVNKKREIPFERVKVTSYPPVAQIAGHMMSSIFFDSLEVDLERLERINGTLALIPPEARKEGGVLLRPIKSLVISPSERISEIAWQHAYSLPRTMRYLYRAVGAMSPSGSRLLSYVLFEASYCRALIDLGYRDTMQQQDEILKFITMS